MKRLIQKLSSKLKSDHILPLKISGDSSSVDPAISISDAKLHLIHADSNASLEYFSISYYLV